MLWTLIDEVAAGPSVTDAIAQHGIGFADQVADEVRDRTRHADARLERAGEAPALAAPARRQSAPAAAGTGGSVTLTEGPPHGARSRMSAAQRAAEAAAAGGSPYAGLVSRTLAFFFDILVINCVAWTTGIVVSVGLSALPIPDDVQTVLIAFGSLIALLWAMGYFVVFWSANGQTPGDRLLEIAVRDAGTGLPPRPGKPCSGCSRSRSRPCRCAPASS